MSKLYLTKVGTIVNENGCTVMEFRKQKFATTTCASVFTKADVVRYSTLIKEKGKA